MLGNLARRGGERFEGRGDGLLLACGQLGQNVLDQDAPARRRLVHDLSASRSDRDHHRPAIRPGAMPAVQLLADQPIGHPPSCRRGYIKRGGEVRHPLRSPGGQHDQHPVLSGRGVLGGRPQRRRADRNQRPARGQHGVHDGRFHQRLRLLCSSQYSHYATSRYYFNSPMHTNSESDVLPERPGIRRRPGQRDAVALLLAGADARCASGQALRSAAMAPGMLAQADHLTSGMMTRPKSCSSTKAPAVRQGGQGRL